MKFLFAFTTILLLVCAMADDYCADCSCPRNYDPVCGADGKTYGNSCLAECAGQTHWVPGECCPWP